MNDEPSPWPEERRTQYALFGVGGLLLAVVAVALVAPDAVPLGEAHVVMVATVASALLLYGLLGAAGDIVDEPREVDDEREPMDPAAESSDDGLDDNAANQARDDAADDGEGVDAELERSDDEGDARDDDR